MKHTTNTYKKLILQELHMRRATRQNPCDGEQLEEAIGTAFSPTPLPPNECAANYVDYLMLLRALNKHREEAEIVIEITIPETRLDVDHSMTSLHDLTCIQAESRYLVSINTR
jgi:hypothetical protein